MVCWIVVTIEGLARMRRWFRGCNGSFGFIIGEAYTGGVRRVRVSCIETIMGMGRVCIFGAIGWCAAVVTLCAGMVMKRWRVKMM